MREVRGSSDRRCILAREAFQDTCELQRLRVGCFAIDRGLANGKIVGKDAWCHFGWFLLAFACKGKRSNVIRRQTLLVLYTLGTYRLHLFASYRRTLLHNSHCCEPCRYMCTRRSPLSNMCRAGRLNTIACSQLTCAWKQFSAPPLHFLGLVFTSNFPS